MTLLLLLLPELLLGVVTVLGVVGVGSGLGTYFSLTVIYKLIPDISFSLKDASENLIPPTLIVPLPTLLPVTVNETIPKNHSYYYQYITEYYHHYHYLPN